MIPTGISTEVVLAREYCLVEVGELGVCTRKPRICVIVSPIKVLTAKPCPSANSSTHKLGYSSDKWTPFNNSRPYHAARSDSAEVVAESPTAYRGGATHQKNQPDVLVALDGSRTHSYTVSYS